MTGPLGAGWLVKNQFRLSRKTVCSLLSDLLLATLGEAKVKKSSPLERLMVRNWASCKLTCFRSCLAPNGSCCDTSLAGGCCRRRSPFPTSGSGPGHLVVK